MKQRGGGWVPGLVRHCDGKVRYFTRDAAELALKVIGGSKRRQYSEKRTLHAYECPTCGFFHLGHPRRTR